MSVSKRRYEMERYLEYSLVLSAELGPKLYSTYWLGILGLEEDVKKA